MGKIRRAKKNLILLEIMELINEAIEHDSILVIHNVPTYVKRFLRQNGLEDYYREYWETFICLDAIFHKEIYVLGNDHYQIECSSRYFISKDKEIKRFDFNDIKNDINNLIKGGII